MSTKNRPWWILQLLASIAIIGALVKDVDSEQMVSVFEYARLDWLLLAVLLKFVTLTLHELRLWIALPAPRPPIQQVMAIGFAAGVLNLVLPGRAGALASIAFLNRECYVKASTSTAIVGLVNFLEAAVFGLMLLGVLLFGASQWESILGAQEHARALQWVTIGTLGGIAVAILIAILSRFVSPTERYAIESPSPIQIIRDTFAKTGDTLSSPSWLIVNTSTAAIQVAGMICAFAIALPAVGIHIPTPWVAAAGVLALSSIAAIVLPPSYGAGPAAASVVILSAFGVGQASALAYAGAWWIISQLPATLLGIPCLWGRKLKRTKY